MPAPMGRWYKLQTSGSAGHGSFYLLPKRATPIEYSRVSAKEGHPWANGRHSSLTEAIDSNILSLEPRTLDR